VLQAPQDHAEVAPVRRGGGAIRLARLGEELRQPWQDRGGVSFTGRPAAIYNPVGETLEVYAIGGNGHVYEMWWRSGGWSSWHDRGGTNLVG
jgi:hypothetical protein